MMKHVFPIVVAAVAPFSSLLSQSTVTIYNQNFAVVRDTLPLDLKPGVNEIVFADITAYLEPTSVILRDPGEKISLQILEQNYRRDRVSQALLLAHHEGMTIDFETTTSTGEKKIVQGKIIRSGYIPPSNPFLRLAHGLYDRLYPNGDSGHIEREQPIVEVDGKLRFELPGLPLFPSLSDESLLKPTLSWKIEANTPGRLNAELAYITSQIKWEADYTITTQKNDDTINLNGWVSISNQSGKTFRNAIIKLMAGDVEKFDSGEGPEMDFLRVLVEPAYATAPDVSGKVFDEFYLYTLQRPMTLYDNETKQVQFINAFGVKAPRVYIYDGLTTPRAWQFESPEKLRKREFGIQSSNKVKVFREIKNSKANQLGEPLPKGRIRFYQQDPDSQLEFIGDNWINHTPRNETVRLYTGNAFDLLGERVRTDFQIDESRKTLVESFEIKLRNRKKEAVNIQVIEHLFRTATWEITASSTPYVKQSSQKIEFQVHVEPNEEKKLTYTARYTWESPVPRY